MKSTFAFILVAALATACGSAAPEPAAGPVAQSRAELDPVGTYSFSTTVQGSNVDGQLRITGSPGSWGGSLYSDATGELPLTSVAVEGQELRLTADTPDGTVYIRMTFDGETFTGNWTLGPEGGVLTGRRVSR